jgi:hypothetical protein
MSISELYEIGKRSRHPLSGIRKRSERGREQQGLVTLLDEDVDDTKATEIDRHGEHDGIHHDKAALQRPVHQQEASASEIDGSSSRRPKCLLCRVNTSKYNCPSCNIPYCSLNCYRSNVHSSCSQPFLQRTLRSELGGNGRGKLMVDESERKSMMDVLRRMNALGKENGKDDHDQEDRLERAGEVDDEGEEEEDEKENLKGAAHSVIDLGKIGTAVSACV